MNKIENIFTKLADIEKQAYPNFSYQEPQKQYDLNKWVMSMQKIKSMQDNGIDKFSAVNNVTKGWGTVELDSFLNWMKYYESGDFVKYKFASLYSTNPGYYLNMDSNKADFSKVEEEEIEEDNKEERLGTFKKKMISRLNSLEKLLSSKDGQEFLPKDLDDLINIIFDLKKKFTKLKIASFYSFHDEIIRVANRNKSSVDVNEFLLKLAQVSAPPPAQQAQPTENKGNVTGVPFNGVGAIPPPNNTVIPQPPSDLPAPPPEPGQPIPDQEKSKGADDFVSKFKGDLNKADTINEEDYIFISEAQEALTDLPRPASGNANPELQPAVKSDYDVKIDDIFKNVKVEDVISKLDTLANIFKEREIPRQLSIVDMMLNALNLSQMFPQLSESLNKALESNNYILTRVEDIVSKLRGSIKGAPIDLTPKENTAADPQAAVIKENLQKDQDAEKKRKELRKQVENEALTKMSEPPTVELNDIAEQPAPVAQPQPAPPKAQ